MIEIFFLMGKRPRDRKGEEGKGIGRIYQVHMPTPHKKCKHYVLQMCANNKNKESKSS